MPSVTPFPGTLRAMLELQARRHARRPLIRLPDGELTYAEADRLADRMAQVLAGLGVAPGDLVAAISPNSTAMLATWFGCAKLGAVWMPVNALLVGAPLRAVMGHAGAAVVVCDHRLLGELDAVRAALPKLRHVLVPGPPGLVPGWALSLERLLEEAPTSVPAPLDEADPGAPGKLMYTSGTTGQPKGVVWSRHCEAVWGRHYGDELFLTAAGETAYTCLPLFHITCQGTVLASLWRGGRVVVDDGFEPLSFWRRIRESEAVLFTFVGTILAILARRPERPGDHDNPVRRILGAAAPTDLWRDVERRFGVEILETYGQTETASCWMFPRDLPSQPGRVGTPSVRWEARVVAADGSPAPDGQPGEIWMRPRQAHVMFEGYLDERGAVRSAYDAEGWYHTGDLGIHHPEGDYSFAGRLREAIRRRGEMIPAATVESAALEHPDVAEAAAVGVPAPLGVEEEVKLCVVPRDGRGLDPAGLHAHLAARLPAFMTPRYIAVLPALPKTPTTRVRKVALSEQGVAGAWDARGRRGGVRPRPEIT
ncbi:MAG: ATP-dependent acyl-CoA ligase [Candidatus Dormibacteria bacterium]